MSSILPAGSSASEFTAAALTEVKEGHPLSSNSTNQGFEEDKPVWGRFVRQLSRSDILALKTFHELIHASKGENGVFPRRMTHAAYIEGFHHTFTRSFSGKLYSRALERKESPYIDLLNSRLDELPIERNPKQLKDREILAHNMRTVPEGAIQDKLQRAFAFAQKPEFLDDTGLAHWELNPFDPRDFTILPKNPHELTLFTPDPTCQGSTTHSYLSNAGSKLRYNLNYGVGATIGKRFAMEDTYIANGWSNRPIFGVFDGHSGLDLAARLPHEVHSYLHQAFDVIEQAPNVDAAMFNLLKTMFVQIGRRCRDPGIWNYLAAWLSGTLDMFINGSRSTATVAIPFREHLWVACVGDSRAIIAIGGKAINMSLDGKPKGARDPQHTYASDAFKRGADRLIVQWSSYGNSPAYVAKGSHSGPNISRAVGYNEVKSGINPRSKIIRIPLEDIVGGYLVIASDGIWDVFSSNDVAKIVEELSMLGWNSEQIGAGIVQAAYKRGSTDNLTAVVVKFSKAEA